MEKTNIALELSEIEKQVSGLISENIDLKKQLTEAKEIIRAICEGYSSIEVSEREMIERIQNAEAFLNSEVEK